MIITKNDLPVLDELFGSSKIRVKILKVLSLANGEVLHAPEIAIRAGIKRRSCQSQLKILRDLKIITDKKFGRIRAYRIRTEDSRVQALRDLFIIWDEE